MGPIVYNKLVRDKTPTIIEQDGRRCETYTLTDEAYTHALRKKLLEEAQEAADAPPNILAAEIADIIEVATALCQHLYISAEEVQRALHAKREQAGSYSQRIFLIWADKEHDRE